LSNILQIRPAVLIDAVARMQAGIRSQTAVDISQWNRTIQLVREAEAKAELKLDIPAPLVEGVSEVVRQLDEADFFEALQRASRSKRRARELLAYAKADIGRRRKERVAVVDATKSSLKAAWDSREDVVRTAFQQKSEVEGAAREALEEALRETGKMQQGCMLTGGLGCLGLGAYLVAFIGFGAAGIQLGPDKPLGGLLLLVAVLPLLAGIVMQIGYSLKRAALEAEINAKRTEAQSAYDHAVAAADAVYKGKLPQLRERLTEAEAELAKFDIAVQFLRQDDNTSNES